MLKQIRPRFWLGLLGLLSVCAAHAEDGSLPQYIRRVWEGEDDIPSPVIRAVVQSQDGYIWVATDETLNRFDGVRFVEFDHKDSPDKRERWMAALAEDRAGGVWASACDGGLLHIKNEVTERYTHLQGLPTNYVLSVCVDSKGTVWAGTAKGLAELRNGKFIARTNEPHATAEAVRCIMEDSAGNLWVGTAKGLNILAQGKFISFPTNEPVAESPIMCVLESKDHTIWVGMGNGLACLRDDRWVYYTDRDGLAHNTIRALCEDDEQNIWIGSHGGLQRFQDGAFWPVPYRDAVSFEPGDAISDVYVYSLFLDREKNLWAGTSAGLHCLRREVFHTITKDDGLGHNQATAILEDSSGSVWVGTFGGGLSRYRDGEWVNFQRNDGLPSNHIIALWEDRTGAIWIGTDGGGAGKFENERFTKVNLSYPNSSIKGFCEDTNGQVWVVSSAGVGIIEEREKINKNITLPNAKAIACDKDNFIWVGGKPGLLRWRNRKAVIFTKKDGLPSDAINSIYVDDNNTLWLGTDYAGLVRYKDGKFNSFRTSEGPFNERVLHVMEDARGGFWLSTRNGIYYANEQELNDYCEGRTNAVYFAHFGRADGLHRAQCNGIGQPAGWRMHDGRLWIPQLYGVVVFDPIAARINPIPPQVRIEKVLQDDQHQARWQEGKFGSGSGHFDFHFTGLSYIVPEKVSFLYKLEGFDAHWQDGGNRRVARYTNLRPGYYRFLVKACNNDGVWNETPASFSFSLAPHFYQTMPFYGVCIATFFLLVAAGWGWRGRQLKQREAQLRRVVSERTRALQQEVIERKEAEQDTLAFSRLGQLLSQANTIEEAAETIANTADELIGWVACSIYAYNEEDGRGQPVVIFNVINGRRVNVTKQYSHLDLSSVAKKAVEQGAQLVQRDETNFTNKEGNSDPQYRPALSRMYVPMQKQGKIAGVLSIQGNSNHVYDKDDLKTLRSLADYCGGAFERIRTEDALHRSERVIARQERLAAVGQLSAGVAHEFNNIITVIKGHASLLEESPRLSPEEKLSIENISISADRAANLTRQMLAFSRKQIMQPKPLNLTEVVQQVGKMIERLLGENISVNIRVAPELPTVMADPGMIEQIILNLAINARDAMPKGGQLSVSAEPAVLEEKDVVSRGEARPGKFVCLVVSDTGTGMDAHILQHIFEPFFTTKEVGKGTGLGLSTVYGIVKQHNGWIEVASEKNRGTTFTIFIPVTDRDAAASQVIPAVQVTGGKETILFVEDEPDILRLARQALEKYGYRILQAENGNVALKIWSEHKDRVDLLLTDMVMPEGVSGADLARQLRAEKPDLKVIFTSGYNQEMLEKNSLLDTAYRFVPKPYQPKALAAVIRETLDQT